MSTETERLQVADVTPPRDVAAGGFSAWLRGARAALGRQSTADVPCGTCNACCRSSYFIHIRADERQTLARIPAALLFPAPGRPVGNVLMGYDENGHCPMLVNGACSIYADRPQTCREFDCRIFAAAGIAAGQDITDPVSHRSARWRFDYRSETDVAEHKAVRAAARFLRDHPECFTGAVGNNATRLAIFAVTVYDVFLEMHAEHHEAESMPADAVIVEAVLAAKAKFDSMRNNGEGHD
jgi:hypothetical protein